MKKVIINGQRRETDSMHIAQLVAELGFAKGTVLVEHNGTALRPAEWDAASVSDGDRIELLRVAAGG